MRLKRKWKVTACTMPCKRRWQWGEEDGRDEGVPQKEGGVDRRDWPQQRTGVEVPGQDGPRGGDDTRRVQLTARPSGTCGEVRVGVKRPTDQGRPAALGEKCAMEVLAKDRVRPGREAPGRLWRPAPLGCCLETEWTCRCCGTVWYKKIAKDQ